MKNYTPAFRPVVSWTLLVCLLAVLGTIAGGQQPATKQERPRRVGSSASNESAPAAPATSVKSQGDGQDVDENDVVKVDTQLVAVPAAVADANGRPLVNLRADNFVIYEDNAPQRIANFATTDAPYEVALLLDTSGSTRDDVALIKGAAKAFIDALRPGDKVSISAFNSDKDDRSALAQVQVLCPLTSDRKILETAIESIGASNGTPFYDSLVKISDEVFSRTPAEQLRGRRALVALTDGVDSSSVSAFNDARERLQRSGIACYFIEVNTEEFVEDRLMGDCQSSGALRLSQAQLKRYRSIFAPNSDAADYANFCQMGQFERMHISRSLYNLARREMTDLARVSGGKTFEAAELSDARAAFAQVAREIGTQYSLGYYPTNKARDGHYRQIRVVVKGVNGESLVRAREGYYAPRG